MRRFIAIIIILALAISSVPAFAAKGRRGASDRAYEKASEEAVFHRIGDWFATRGKSEEEKAVIIAERKATRAAKRAQKEAERKKRQLEKEAARKKKQLEKKAKKSQREMKGKMEGMKKKLGR